MALLYSFATGGPIAAALKALTVAVLAPIYLLVAGFSSPSGLGLASILVLATANERITAEGGLSDATCRGAHRRRAGLRLASR